MIQALPIDVCAGPKAHSIGAPYMSGSAYATTPIQWKESSQIPTIGTLTGEFTGMLKERKFHVVRVSANHSVGIASTGQPDVVVMCKGDVVKISGSRKSHSIFSSIFSRLCRFLPSSLYPEIERLIKPCLLKKVYTEHWQI
jgi:hypothetical protein